MRKHFVTHGGSTVLISFYSEGSTAGTAYYSFEVRKGKKMEFAKVTTKSHVARLLHNGFHGSKLRFEGVDNTTQKFFRHCAGVQ